MRIGTPTLNKVQCKPDYTQADPHLAFTLDGTVSEQLDDNNEVYVLFIQPGTTSPALVCKDKVSKKNTQWTKANDAFQSIQGTACIALRVSTAHGAKPGSTALQYSAAKPALAAATNVFALKLITTPTW